MQSQSQESRSPPPEYSSGNNSDSVEDPFQSEENPPFVAGDPAAQGRGVKNSDLKKQETGEDGTYEEEEEEEEDEEEEDEEDDDDDNEEEEESEEKDESIPAEEQKRIMKRLEREQPQYKLGQKWYMLSSSWWRDWREYVKYDWNNYYPARRPGKIDNNSLLEPGQRDLVRRHLYERQDFILISKEQWDTLISWYGGGPELARPVIYCYPSHVVEIRPLELLFVKSSQKNSAVRMMFSKAESIKVVREEVCKHLNLQPANIRIWDYADQVQTKHFEDLDKSLSDYKVINNQYLLLEERLPNGSWPPKPQRPSYGYGYGSWGGGYDRGREPTDPGKCGLANLGNTCFMNSSLQSLSNIPMLTNHFLTNNYKADLNTDNPLGTGGKLAEQYSLLLRELWGGEYKYYSPRDFKAKLEKFAPQFRGMQQHDSQELLAYLLDGLHEDLNRVKKKPYVETKEAEGRPDEEVSQESWDRHLARNDSVIVDWFHGQLKSRLVCPDCSRISVTFDPFMYLSLPLPITTTREIDIFYIPSDPQMPVGEDQMIGSKIKYRVTVPKAGKIKDLKQAIAELVGHSEQNIVITEVNYHYIRRLFTDIQSLDEITGRSDINVYYVDLPDDDDDEDEEVEDNNDATSKKGNNNKDEEDDEDDEDDDDYRSSKARAGGNLGSSSSATSRTGTYFSNHNYYGYNNSNSNSYYNSNNYYNRDPEPPADPNELVHLSVVLRVESNSTYYYNQYKEIKQVGTPFILSVKRGISYEDLYSKCVERLGHMLTPEALDVLHPSDSIITAATLIHESDNNNNNNNNIIINRNVNNYNYNYNSNNDDDSDNGEYIESDDDDDEGVTPAPTPNITDNNNDDDDVDMTDDTNTTVNNADHTLSNDATTTTTTDVTVNHTDSMTVDATATTSNEDAHTAESSDTVGDIETERLTKQNDMVDTTENITTTGDAADYSNESSGVPNVTMDESSASDTSKDIEMKEITTTATTSHQDSDSKLQTTEKEEDEEEEDEENDDDDDEEEDEEENDELAHKTKDLFTLVICDISGSRSSRELSRGKTLNLRDRETLGITFKKEDYLLFVDERKESVIKHSSASAELHNDDDDPVPIRDCLELFSAEEKLGPDDLWYCNKCKEHKQATKKFDIWKLPPLLVIHLKRFSYKNRYSRDKLETLVEFPLTDFDLSDFQHAQSDIPAIYDLVAVSNHYGGMGGGHYTAYAKNVNDKTWLKFDDSNVSKASESNICTSAAYVLFYQRQDYHSMVPSLKFVPPPEEQEEEEEEEAVNEQDPDDDHSEELPIGPSNYSARRDDDDDSDDSEEESQPSNSGIVTRVSATGGKSFVSRDDIEEEEDDYDEAPQVRYSTHTSVNGGKSFAYHRDEDDDKVGMDEENENQDLAYSSANDEGDEKGEMSAEDEQQDDSTFQEVDIGGNDLGDSSKDDNIVGQN